MLKQFVEPFINVIKSKSTQLTTSLLQDTCEGIKADTEFHDCIEARFKNDEETVEREIKKYTKL